MSDVLLGLDDPTKVAWDAWHEDMLARRAAAGAPELYDDPSTAWSDSRFRQLFLFMFDESFFARGAYRTRDVLDRARAMFGRVDEVLLWQAYPRLGFDSRTQFDFFRDMPGGLEALRREVADVVHASGARVFIAYNPWDVGTHEELAEIVARLDADGVMLDTMTRVPEGLARAVTRAKRGVVFAPELRPKDEDLASVRQSWAQWFDVPDGPSIYRHKWLFPRHRQFAIARWDTSRRRDIVYSFFNGSGLILWDNVFGTHNPYSREDRRLIAETGAVLDRYEELFARGEWVPLVPTGVPGLDANRFTLGARAIVTFRNRTPVPLAFTLREPAPAGLAYAALWDERDQLRAGDAVSIEPGGTQAIALDDPASLRRAREHLRELSRHADVDMPGYDERAPEPRSLARSARTRSIDPKRMIALPGGEFVMRVRHERRECGCYGATWGWHYKDVIAHELRVTIAPFAIRATAVTSAEFLEFVRSTGYEPEERENFLRSVSGADGDLPVTHVSLADARAFAAWRGERLPTEAEWQWAAEGAGLGRRFPWGDEARTFPNALRPARDESTATPHGVMGLSGNAWELTESERSDGHTRFVMLRGGVYLPPGQSEWLVARGARPNDSHAKYLLLSDALDRSATISFRTVS